MTPEQARAMYAAYLRRKGSMLRRLRERAAVRQLPLALEA